jgi:hypothetical protein
MASADPRSNQPVREIEMKHKISWRASLLVPQKKSRRPFVRGTAAVHVNRQGQHQLDLLGPLSAALNGKAGKRLWLMVLAGRLTITAMPWGPLQDGRRVSARIRRTTTMRRRLVRLWRVNHRDRRGIDRGVRRILNPGEGLRP